VLTALAAAVADRATLELFPLGDLPLYNQDIDIEPPLPAVLAFRDAIAAADGVIIAFPSITTACRACWKKRLDWASRPMARPS